MSSNRFLLLAFLGAVLGACASEPGSIVCPTTGITCPTGTICAAAQPVCLVSSCGNGVTDAGEQCDDGNIHEGDGCSPTCKREECGNNIQDPGEVCDDGNTDSGDGCAGDCLSLEDCGNGVIDVGEECDDMNNDNTDACVMCKNAICGDGFKRLGVEECDGDNMGNPDVEGDGCSAFCQLEGCHNGRLDPGEECDDMNFENTDACVFECKNARCGDGVIRVGVEECDGDVDTDGDGIPEDTCSDTCHLNGCGNGIKDPGEQCDDGCDKGVPGECEPEDNGDGCSSTCQFENCGNGSVDAGEDCDGGGVMTADCNIDCTTSVCGDGKRNAVANEDCDNGIANSDNSNCTLDCKLNVCGDGKQDLEAPGIEACDEGPGGNLDDGMGCSSTCMLEGCGNGVIDTGEQCEETMEAQMNNNDGCINCQVARCGDGFVYAGFEQCDRVGPTIVGTPPVMGADCPITGPRACNWVYCGNGVLELGEQCDDGDNDNNDGCSSTCVREYCGDGIKNGAEACDGPGETSGCDIDCTLPTCGDGIVNDKYVVPSSGGRVEQCDPPSVANGCSATCQFERCGNNIIDPGEECDGSAMATPPVMGATCGTTGASACRWIYCGNGILDAGEECDNGANNSNSAACTATCKVNVCGDGHQLAGIEGCDHGSGPTGNGANRACTPDCQPNLCGDGYPFTGPGGTEECDDGNSSNTDACTTTCRTPKCGDGQINGSEECDDGNTNSGDGCHGVNCTIQNNWTCTGTVFSVCTANPVCGNGIKEASEACDDGDNDNGDGCSMGCAIEPGFTCSGVQPSTCVHTPVCGDGIVEGTEMCDNLGHNNGVDCIDTDAPPAYGAENACLACNNSCMAVISMDFCGDNAINGTEVCDGSQLNGQTCVMQGFDGGTLACNATCSAYDTSACTND